MILSIDIIQKMTVELYLHGQCLGVVPVKMYEYTEHLLRRNPLTNFRFDFNPHKFNIDEDEVDFIDIRKVTDVTQITRHKKDEYVVSTRDILDLLTVKPSTKKIDDNLGLGFIIDLVKLLETEQECQVRYHEDQLNDLELFNQFKVSLNISDSRESDMPKIDICWDQYDDVGFFKEWLKPHFSYPSLDHYLTRVKNMRPSLKYPFLIILGEWEWHQHSPLREMCMGIQKKTSWDIDKIQLLLSQYGLACKGNIEGGMYTCRLILNVFEYDGIGEFFVRCNPPSW
jgi:hypothetical protein